MELAVLHGLANGLQSKEIAEELGRGTPTVERYVRELYLRFNARSRAHLVARAFCMGILDKKAFEPFEPAGRSPATSGL